MKQGIRRFFKYARERHKIFLNRAAGRPRPWTKDPILDAYRFTNVFRELDKTTKWFHENVRSKLHDRPEVLLATVVFRLLNRIETGEAVFLQEQLEPSRETAFEAFARTGRAGHLQSAIMNYCGKGPYVTGAYIISSPPGFPKLDGMMEVLERFYRTSHSIPTSGLISEYNWKQAANTMLAHPGAYGLNTIWEWLRQFDYLGSFHSYEIVTDLRHTTLLGSAPDIMTWANPGPGARRGANRVMGRDYKDKSAGREQLIQEMREILAHSKSEELWPRGWPPWEMREVEHSFCEWDKYERVRLGQGRPRGVYR